MDEDRNGRKDPIKDGRKNGTGKEGGVVQAKSADNKIPPKRDEKINTRSALKPGKDEADALTRIYNRSAFFARAGELIAQKEAGYYLLSCVDIDSFKVINDQYGMAAGDAVLRHVARCIRKTVAAMGGICGRISADQFAVLFPYADCAGEELQRFRERASLPACIPQRIRLRVGRYRVEDLSVPVDVMYDRALVAADAIRDSYGKDIEFYNEDMRNLILRRQRIVNAMEGALRAREFEVWFQPQYNHATGALVGAEALARWRRDGIYISPAEFVPIFEETGFIYEMDRFIWEEACRYLAKWKREGGTVLPVSVNLSRRDLLHEDFPGVLTEILGKYHLTPADLRLEITESAFSQQSKQMIAKAEELVREGFTVEIDDFGSGYSSLNTLKDVPASVLKLDMHFFDSSENGQRAGCIVESVVRMAKWLDMIVIAEGVETREQADYLKTIGCYYIQGYYYARPMPAADYEALFSGAPREPEVSHIKTLQTFDHNEFWNPKSMDSLIFNSYVGGACIFEYRGGMTEMLRVNDQYRRELSGLLLPEVSLHDAAVSRYIGMDGYRTLTATIEKAVTGGEVASCELTVRNRDKTAYLRASVRVIARTDDRYLCYGMITNLTDLRMAERKQRDTAVQLRALLENIEGGVSLSVYRGEGIGEIYVSDGFCALFGYTREEYENEVPCSSDLIFPEDRKRVEAELREIAVRSGSGVCEFRCRNRRGEVIFLRVCVSVVTLSGFPGTVLLSVATDITAERENLRQLAFLSDTAHEILAQPDAGCAINRALFRILSYFEGERAYVFENDPVHGLLHNTFEVCAPGISPQIGSLQNVPETVAKEWVWSGEPVAIPDVAALPEERPLRAMLLSQEITSLILVPLCRDGVSVGFIGVDNPKAAVREPVYLTSLGDYISFLLLRRDLNKQLTDEQQLSGELLDNLPCGAALYEMRGEVPQTVRVNRRFTELTGQTEAALRERPLALSYVHPDDRAMVTAAVEQALSKRTDIMRDFRILCADGSYRMFRADGRVRDRSDGKPFLYVTFTLLPENGANCKKERET